LPGNSSDLAERLTTRVQLTTDGHKTYLEAVEEAFGTSMGYALLIKIYGKSKAKDGEIRYSPAECMGSEVRVVSGNPDGDHISTSYVERQNLTNYGGAFTLLRENPLLKVI